MPITFTAPPKLNFPVKKLLKICLSETASTYELKIGELNYVFVSDEDLLEMNRQYLDHDYYTDIITFDNSDDVGILEGDVFISRDRVDENGQNLGNGILKEYCRVVAHGLLHLCGLKDKTESEIAAMRNAEDLFISNYLEKVLESESKQ
jgi:probable rRNA maturation factor